MRQLANRAKSSVRHHVRRSSRALHLGALENQKERRAVRSGTPRIRLSRHHTDWEAPADRNGANRRTCAASSAARPRTTCCWRATKARGRRALTAPRPSSRTRTALPRCRKTPASPSRRASPTRFAIPEGVYLRRETWLRLTRFVIPEGRASPAEGCAKHRAECSRSSVRSGSERRLDLVRASVLGRMVLHEHGELLAESDGDVQRLRVSR